MTRDDMYQVVYKCSVCGRIHQIDDTSLARIAEDFEDLGWHNTPQKPDETGNVEYVVLCPECGKELTDELEEMAADYDELQETYDGFLAGTGAW